MTTLRHPTLRVKELEARIEGMHTSFICAFNQLLDLKVKYAESYREENKQLGFLTPVQRAQYYSLRERLLDALKQARASRRAGGGMGGQKWMGRHP